MPAYRVEIRPRESASDPQGAAVAHEIAELGIESVQSAHEVRLFFLFGELSEADAHRVGDQLLTDPVTEQLHMGSSPAPTGGAMIEVHLKAGVMDPVAASAEKAIAGMGVAIESVRTARRYELAGDVSRDECETIARRLLANSAIEEIYYEAYTPPATHGHSYELNVVDVPIRDLDDAALEQLSKDSDLFLNLTEMNCIQDYYRRIGREPRDVELETLAQTWSEHCVHKTFRSDVCVRDNAGEVVEEIPNLIKSTIFGITEELDKPWCISVFKDNAGVIEFDDEHAVCFKVETHNHPSAIDPYGGASTGIGGVVRDPLGTGMGARPVANTDVFCFGPADMPLEDLPKGVLHPRRVMRGVVAGVRDYGNRMGIPTVNGALYFDEKYLGNPLVYCGTVGLLDRAKCFKHPTPGDAIVCVGGRTGRDGIHGATFSSGELTHEHETAFSHAVQIGNAITEKKMLDVIIQARDADLYNAITDCGAGGFSSAVGEMGEELGAEVHLERAPLKYAGLSYTEIWISEAQERMVLAVPPENVDRILALFAAEDVEAVVIGTFGTEGQMLRLFYEETPVGELEMDFLHNGLPRPTKDAVYEKVDRTSPAPAVADSYNDVLLKILAAPNVASKEWVVRQYDHEVQGGSAVKPLVGVDEDGPGDSAVVRPVLTSRKGVVIACGLNPALGDYDPYQSALHAIDEALRNMIAVGGNLSRTALLDNFCWGNCNKPDRMGALVQAAKACRDAARVFETPFISGKDSLNNEFQTESGETIAIPPTLLISAISVIDDVGRCITADAKEAGNFLFLVGRTGGQMGGSHFLRAADIESGTDVPPVDLALNRRVMEALQRSIEAGAVRSCHDLSEGGLAVAATEMAFSGGLGVALDLAAVPNGESAASPAALLFAEDSGRFLVEVAPDQHDAFMRAMKDCPVGELGTVTDTGRVVIRSDNSAVIDLAIDEAKAAWQKTFDW
ncbi:MAG: phosphoribosylformylglycinamidine synthase subunit PurL [Planctomycetota bacterium]|jgi:phosphoribosylformylglycinamidine synthase